MKGDYDAGKVEEKWQEKWDEADVAEYSQDVDNFSIDTPPPTVSGSLHFGHTYGNTLTDFKARFERMRNGEVLFPFGYDNNGIASERLTERELGIDHSDFSRREFQEKVREVCQEYEKNFEEVMKEFAFSMDWSRTYKTIEDDVQRVSQLSFVDLYSKGREYREEAPAIWCPECETAISQVETEDMEKDSHFNDIEFPLATGDGSITISTTRPELLPACVAVFVHPEDEANQPIVGEKAQVPLYDYEVPILEDERVDPEEGSGVVMCCTFGDKTDIEWYQAHNLDLRIAIDETGTMTELAGDLEGLSTEEAREEIVDRLDQEDYLLDQRPITHTVQVHERCDTEIEFRVTEQWYVKLLDRKDEYLEAGRKMDWYPEKMFSRYKHWIEGLEWDWCISRQRDSGIPFPVWYCEDCGEEIVADPERLPVDPIEDEPGVDECPECSGTSFRPETDVFDTWATSSLTPLINAGWDWKNDKEGFRFEDPELYPIDLRPQGHDIISFWLFHTVVKSYEHTGQVPFHEVLINGHVLDENREKMSKSRGNVTTPQEVLEDYPVDAARYWAGTVKPGDDLPLKDQDLIEGEKLLRKLWNASKLVESLDQGEQADDLKPVDRWIIAVTDQALNEVTELFEEYRFSQARDRMRSFFWNTFCDDYLEIAKQRNCESMQTGLRTAHRKILKMFAPVIPHITEEIYQDLYAEGPIEKASIHLSQWPEESSVDADLEKGRDAMKAISSLRKYKSDNQLSMNAEIEKAVVFADVEEFKGAIKKAMHVEELEVRPEEGLDTRIKEIKLNYEEAGPRLGEKVGEVEEGLESNDWMIEDGHLVVAGERLKPELFEVREEKAWSGDGELYGEEVPVAVES